jgi:hypothetical protein
MTRVAKKLTGRDKAALGAIKRCGFISLDASGNPALETSFEVTAHRMGRLVTLGYLKSNDDALFEGHPPPDPDPDGEGWRCRVGTRPDLLIPTVARLAAMRSSAAAKRSAAERLCAVATTSSRWLATGWSAAPAMRNRTSS